MNKQFEQRLRSLEHRQELRSSKKDFLPDWLLEDWHAQTGLPFDTYDNAMDSIRKMHEPEYRDRRQNDCADPSNE